MLICDVVGEVVKLQLIFFCCNMIVFDVMIQVGGLMEFVVGNCVVFVCYGSMGQGVNYCLCLSDFVKDGDVCANVYVFLGDVIIIL